MDIKTKVTIVFGPDAKPSFFMAKSNKGTLKQRAVAPIGNPSGIKKKAPASRGAKQSIYHTPLPVRFYKVQEISCN